jgi:hypothetical protein
MLLGYTLQKMFDDYNNYIIFRMLVVYEGLYKFRYC